MGLDKSAMGRRGALRTERVVGGKERARIRLDIVIQTGHRSSSRELLDLEYGPACARARLGS